MFETSQFGSPIEEFSLGKTMKSSHVQRRATPQERREKRLTIIVREARPVEEAHAARAGRMLLCGRSGPKQVIIISELYREESLTWVRDSLHGTGGLEK